MTIHGTNGVERYRNLLSGRYGREKAQSCLLRVRDGYKWAWDMWWPGRTPHGYLGGERSWKLLEINDGVRFDQNRTDNTKSDFLDTCLSRMPEFILLYYQKVSHLIISLISIFGQSLWFMYLLLLSCSC